MTSVNEKDVCRLCAKQGNNYHYIFDPKAHSIVEKIHNCLPLVIHLGDKLPAHVCNDCLEALDISDKLRAQCLLADSMFRKQLEIDPIVVNIKQEKDPLIIKNEIDTLDINFEEVNACDEDDNIYEASCKDESDPLDDSLHHKYEKHEDGKTVEGTNINNDSSSADHLIEDYIIKDAIEIKEENIPTAEDIPIARENKEQTYCDICKITIEAKNLMELHLKFHEPREVFCSRCYHSLPSPHDLYIHRKTVHKLYPKSQMKWFCEVCERMTDNSTVAMKHMKRCTKQRFSCQYCSQSFAGKLALVLHQKRSHLDLIVKDPNFERFKCDQCGKMYVDRETYTNHLRLHRVKESGTHKCTLCERNFFTAASVKAHIEKVHCAEQKIHKCDICSKIFSGEQYLKMHQRKHVKQPCSQCGKQFDDVTTLNQHLSKDHNTPTFTHKRYFCLQCNASFPKKWLLRNHTNIHTGKQPYTCETCKKTFRTYAAHWAHRRLHRNTDFFCDYCNKKFLTKGNLAKHIPTHQPPEDWQYECEICNMKFASDSRLLWHMEKYQQSHLRTCDICKLDFLGLQRLRRHKRQKHRIHEDNS